MAVGAQLIPNTHQMQNLMYLQRYTILYSYSTGPAELETISVLGNAGFNVNEHDGPFSKMSRMFRIGKLDR